MNIQWYKIGTQIGVVKEALRTLKGYDKDDGREIPSLVDHDFTNYNEVVRLHPELTCLLEIEKEDVKEIMSKF